MPVICDGCCGEITAGEECKICAFGSRIRAKAKAKGMIRRPPRRRENQGMDLALKRYLTGQDAALPPGDRE